MITFQIIKELDKLEDKVKLLYLQELMNFLQRQAAIVQTRLENEYLEVDVNE